MAADFVDRDAPDAAAHSSTSSSTTLSGCIQWNRWQSDALPHQHLPLRAPRWPPCTLLASRARIVQVVRVSARLSARHEWVQCMPRLGGAGGTFVSPCGRLVTLYVKTLRSCRVPGCNQSIASVTLVSCLSCLCRVSPLMCPPFRGHVRGARRPLPGARVITRHAKFHCAQSLCSSALPSSGPTHGSGHPAPMASSRFPGSRRVSGCASSAPRLRTTARIPTPLGEYPTPATLTPPLSPPL